MLSRVAAVSLLTLISYGSTQRETSYLGLSNLAQIDNFLNQRGFYQETDYYRKTYLGKEGDLITLYCGDADCSQQSKLTAAMVSFGNVQSCQMVSQYLQSNFKNPIIQGDSISWLHQNGFKLVAINCLDGVPHLEATAQ